MKSATLLKGALAFAAASLIGASLHAQTTFSSTHYDVLFNMYASSGTGSGYDYEVDLGNYKNFLTGGTYATGAVFTLSQISIADISGNSGGQGFGSSWDSDGLVNWSVVGANYQNALRNNAPAFSLFGTGQGTEINQSFGTQTAAQDAVDPYETSLSGVSSTTNSTSATWVTGATDYYSEAGGAGTSPFFGYFDSNFETTANGTTTANLYEFSNSGTGNATELGTFTLSSSGLTYQAAAVPEPSTWATMILGAATLIGIRRRRSA